MTTNEKITLLFAQNNGILKTAKALESGISKAAFYAYTKKHGTERVAQGVYLSPDAWTDAMYLLHLRCDRYSLMKVPCFFMT